MGRCANEELREQKLSRINEERYNSQGCLMKIIEYNDSKNIIIEFQDEYKAKVHTSYRWFLLGLSIVVLIVLFILYLYFYE